MNQYQTVSEGAKIVHSSPERRISAITAKQKILIVDDEIFNVFALKIILEPILKIQNLD